MGIYIRTFKIMPIKGVILLSYKNEWNYVSMLVLFGINTIKPIAYFTCDTIYNIVEITKKTYVRDSIIFECIVSDSKISKNVRIIFYQSRGIWCLL